MATYAEIKSPFYEIIGGGTEGSHAFFTQTQVANWANKALRELAECCLYIDYENEDQIESGDESIELAGFRAWRVEVDDEAVIPVSLHWLAESNRQWREVSGRPRYWYIDGFSSESADDVVTIGFWPICSADNTDVRVYSYRMPIAVTDLAEATEAEIPDWAHLGVVYSMLADALTADTAIKNPVAASIYRGMFEDVKTRLTQRSFSRLPKSYIMGEPGEMNFSVFNQLPNLVPEP